MARTLGAKNLSPRELGMQATIATLKRTIAILKSDNKALKEAAKLATRKS